MSDKADLLPCRLAYEATIPAQVLIWTESDAYKGEWEVVGTADTYKHLYSLIDIANRRADQDHGRKVHERPFLTTGGPRIGTVAVREAN